MSTTIPSASQSPSAYRFHSARVLRALTSWRDTYQNWLGQRSSESPLVQLVLTVAAESGYLGFPRTSLLCRSLQAALTKQSASSSELRSDQAAAVTASLEALEALVNSPQADSVNVAACMQLLRLAFDLTEGEMNRPISGLTFQTDSQVNVAGMTSIHRDMDVYLSARLDSLDRCLEEETWIAAQLASLAEDLACGLQSERPAQRLMRVLRSHRFFHQVDRVCLAGRVPNANQLMIVDACTSDRCVANPLRAGYSCFVNPEGSLFKLRPGTMRIFDDSDRVLSTFASAGRPAQRSIAMIDDMGLRSGLCLAIGRDSELQGFLFLNSCQPQLFRDITVAFSPLISLLGLVATIALDSNGFHKSCGRFGQLDGDLPCTSMLFDLRQFVGFLHTAVQRRIGSALSFDLELNVPERLEDFLYLPAQVAGTLGELILRLQLIKPESTTLPVEIRQRGSEVQFVLPHGTSQASTKQWDWLRWQIDYLRHFIGNTPLQLSAGEQQVWLTVPFEPVLQSHRDIRYSVVY